MDTYERTNIEEEEEGEPQKSLPLALSPANAPRKRSPAQPLVTDSLVGHDPIEIEFPCDGDPGRWPLRRSQVEEWQKTYNGLDVLQSCREALVWIKANPERQKTARGMTRFLAGWIGRAKNNLAPQRNSGGLGRDYGPRESVSDRLRREAREIDERADRRGE